MDRRGFIGMAGALGFGSSLGTWDAAAKATGQPGKGVTRRSKAVTRSFPNAITDRSIIPYPATPPDPGQAGSVIIDPFCGNQILRVTDANTEPNKPGASFTTPSSSEAQPWASDSKRFFIHNSATGTYGLFSFDPVAFTSTLVGKLPGGLSNPAFSYQDETLVWGFKDLQIQQVRADSGKSRIVVDLRDYPELGIPESPPWYLNSLSVDWWDERAVASLGSSQDASYIVIVYDLHLGLEFLNTQTGEYDGWVKGKIEPWTPFTIHNNRISKSGDVVRIAKASPTNERAFWRPGSPSFQSVTSSLTTPVNGHSAMGFSTYYGAWLGTTPLQWIAAPLWRIEAWQNLMNPVPASVPGWWCDYHISVKPDGEDRAPIYISTVNGGGGTNPTTPGAPLTSATAGDNEILAVATDGSGDWWRFAHHYSTGKGSFYTYPRGNVSVDGDFFLFTSDWEITLGGEVPNQRTDVFVLKLE
jgi:hypothetical protein